MHSLWCRPLARGKQNSRRQAGTNASQASNRDGKQEAGHNGVQSTTQQWKARERSTSALAQRNEKIDCEPANTHNRTAETTSGWTELTRWTQPVRQKGTQARPQPRAEHTKHHHTQRNAAGAHSRQGHQKNRKPERTDSRTTANNTPTPTTHYDPEPTTTGRGQRT